MTCATHRNIIRTLDDLRRQGILDATTHAQADQAVKSECEYFYERDADGNCVLRHP